MKEVEFITKQDGVIGINDFSIKNGEYDKISFDEFLNAEEIISDIIANRIDGGFKIELKETPTNKLILFHSTFGRWIRNVYGFWLENNPYTCYDDNQIESGLPHPDELSQTIIEKVAKNV